MFHLLYTSVETRPMTHVPDRQFRDRGMAYVEPSTDDEALLAMIGVRRLDQATVERLSFDATLCRSVLFGMLKVAVQDRSQEPA